MNERKVSIIDPIVRYKRFHEPKRLISHLAFSALLQPLLVVSKRFQAQHEPIRLWSDISKYKSILHCLGTIVRQEGARALWKGFLAGQCVVAGKIYSQYFLFDYLVRLNSSMAPQSSQRTVSVTLDCHFWASALTVLAVQPFDTVYTRQVTQGEPKVMAS